MKKINIKNVIKFFIVMLSVVLFVSVCERKEDDNFTEDDQNHRNDALSDTRLGEDEVRALWVNPGGFYSVEAIDNLIQTCESAGINTILPNVMMGENVYFRSVNFAGNVKASEQFDHLDSLITKAHAAGIEVYPWCAVYNLQGRFSDWSCRPFAYTGVIQNEFLSPAHPSVNPYVLSVLNELLAYDIDGLHLDFIRYKDAGYGYSESVCARFNDLYGFDPRDFLDHPERIVPPEEDDYPIRVLCPEYLTTGGERWMLAATERTMSRTEVGYAFVSESPENIDSLRTPGLLIISHYPDVPLEMLEAVNGYLDRGGDVMWVDIKNALLTQYPLLQSMAGITSTKYSALARITLQMDDEMHPGQLLKIKTAGNFPITVGDGGAEVVLRLSSGKPIITINNDNFMVVGFRIMQSTEQQVITLLKNQLNWFRAKAGVTGPDSLAQKREQWIDWRASHILDLVSDVNTMFKGSDSTLVISAAAGIGPKEYYGFYRDGGQWLVEDLFDCIFPMNYAENIPDLQDILDEQMFFTPEGLSPNRIYPGLQIHKGGAPMNADIVEDQIEMVLQYGYLGFSLFAYSYLSDEIIAVVSGF